ncbi:adenylate kinase family protein [Candidatus Nitrosotenuis sp. DW1]|uniref:adenylate kinase family protein n=1 Tax=Candidatus Nitrosotenuis sp. DW1 TaxID=2259672 RepID=UPI0015CC5327|nr:AAA family ATPase [Candidatus Nitrosotenuis sp. DW1]QLH08341.1 shikimate kinase [Candidatus Nitrosotenuis sp. DW1]
MSIVITGNPGTGKHTISCRLAEDLGHTILDLNEIAIKHGICEKKDSTLDVDTKKLARLVKKLITKDSIIVGHLAPYVIERSQIKLAIILRKNPYKLIPVYKKRNYSKKKQTENAASEILGIIAHDSIKKFGLSKSRQIDTTNLTISQTVSKVKRILKKKSKGDNVDWLGMVAKKNDFAKFFPNR